MDPKTIAFVDLIAAAVLGGIAFSAFILLPRRK